MSQHEVVNVLINLDAMAAPSAPDIRRAWAHIFIALGLIHKTMPSNEVLTRDRFMEACGRVWDKLDKSLRSGAEG